MSKYTRPLLRRAPLRISTAERERSSTSHHRLRNLTVASEIHDKVAVSRSGNYRLLWGWCHSCVIPGAMLVLCLRYSCVIHALFMRYSCVIHALFLRYSCVIHALFLRYSAAILALFLSLFPRHHPPLLVLRATASGVTRCHGPSPSEFGAAEN